MKRRNVETSKRQIVGTTKSRKVEKSKSRNKGGRRGDAATKRSRDRGIESKVARARVADFVAAMERIAPTSLAQDWDNVGLIAGDLRAAVSRVLLAIDLTELVTREAVDGKFDLVFAYHPPIFKPIPALRLPSAEPSGFVFECVRHGIAVCSSHTALDAAEGGTNDVLAGLCGIKTTEPIQYIDSDCARCKLVVFVPSEHVDKVAEAVFLAGAGRIGDYTHCSYRLAGEGTFFGTDATNPTVGTRGRLERVPEVRLEVVLDSSNLAAVLQAMRRVHPYEEPAFDVYPLMPAPRPGIGRIGTLPTAVKLGTLVRQMQRGAPATLVQVVGDSQRQVDRAVIVAGSAGNLPFSVDLTPRDVIITGEIRHHDALSILRRDCSAIALGHWASERPVLESLAGRLSAALPGIALHVSQADRDPFTRP